MLTYPMKRRGFLKHATQTLLAVPTLGTLNNLAFAEPSAKPKPEPQAPPRSSSLTLNVREYGATGDGTTKDTAAPFSERSIAARSLAAAKSSSRTETISLARCSCVRTRSFALRQTPSSQVAATWTTTP